MNLSYAWNTALKLLQRKKLSAMRLVFSTSLVSILIATAVTSYLHLHQIVDRHISSISLTLFLNDTCSMKTAREIADDFQKNPSILSSSVRSADSVRAYFNEVHGVDVAEVLPANPFPIVISLQFKPSMLTREDFNYVIENCQQLSGVIDNVAYSSAFIQAVFAERTMLFWLSLSVGVIILILAICLLFFSFRAERIFSASDCHVVELLGAKRSFLGAALTLRNLVCAIVGTIIAVLVSNLIIRYTDSIHYTFIGDSVGTVLITASAVVLGLSFLISRRSIPLA